MKTVHITQTIGWRGMTYAPGDRQIPDDLAIALGLTSEVMEESKSDTLTDLDEPVAPPEPAKPTPKTKRRKEP